MDERSATRAAARQGGRIASWQLEVLGWSEEQVLGRVAAGRLVRRRLGVYAFAPVIESNASALWEAVLAVGGDGVPSHVWGSWQHGLLERPFGPVDVSTTSDRGRRLEGVRVHLRTALRERDVVVVDGLRVASPALCLLGLAHRHPELLAKALNRAQQLLLDVGDLRASARGTPGGRRLLRALDAYDPREERTREELERLALRMLAERGAPVYEPNARVTAGGIDWEVDGLFRAERLVVELQSEAHHATPAERRQDRVKANALQAAGYGLLQWDWPDVTRDGDATVARLLAALAQRSTSSTWAPPPSRRT